jgi:acyl-CoA oxidase
VCCSHEVCVMRFLCCSYARFDHVRIPRFNMLAKHQEVTADGVYRKRQNVKSTSSDVADKIKYIVMISTRVAMTVGAYQVLAKASTIAIRYSAVRLQGFVNTREDSQESGEHPVLNYQVQQYRLFKALSMSYAIFFAAREIRHQLMAFRKGLDEAGDASALPEIHATAAGLFPAVVIQERG